MNNPRILGVNQILNKNYKVFEGFGDPWIKHLGNVEHNFSMLVYGHPKNGKTSYLMQLSKYLTQFGRVYYNSAEEGDTKTMQDAFQRVGMGEVAGKLMLGDRHTYPQMMDLLKGSQKRAKFVIIDSRDYVNLTAAQFKTLTKTFPSKVFIVVCWESAGKPSSAYAKQMLYMVDIKVHVSNFVARAEGRYGGTENFIIWPEKVGRSAGQRVLFN